MNLICISTFSSNLNMPVNLRSGKVNVPLRVDESIWVHESP